MATRNSCKSRGVKRSVLWLRAGAVAVGLGAAVITGQAVASAAPTQDSSPSAGPASKDGKSAVGSTKPRAAAVSRNTSRRGAVGPSRPTNAAPSATPAGDITDTASAPNTPGTINLDDSPVKNNSNGTVRTITGAFTDRNVSSAADAAAVFNDLATSLGAASGFADVSDITVQHASSGQLAETFYRISAQVNGIRVVGSEVILATDASGTVTGLYNYRDSRLDAVDTTLDSRVDNTAEVIALAAQAYLAANTRARSAGLSKTIASSLKVLPELVVDTVDAESAPRLVWQISVSPSGRSRSAIPSDAESATYLVYANGPDAGTVVRQDSTAKALFPTVATTVTATDQDGQSRNLNVTSMQILSFDVLRLNDTIRDIATYRTSYFLGIGPPILPGRQIGKNLFGWDAAGVSAQANMATTYDYYSDVLGLDSFDGNGALIKLSLNYSPRTSLVEIFFGYSNAIWDPDHQLFAFGNLDHFQTALDVVAHEYTHAVISYIVGDGGSVWESGESGALNEAYADIMGALVEGKIGTFQWMFGEDTGRGALRNLANPGAVNTEYGPYRVTYADRYTGHDDDDGEHLNSTIFSHAVYKMMTDPATADVTSEAWATVMYHSLYRLGTSADFADGRTAIVDTATEYGFTQDQLDAINDAFDDAGIAAA